MDGFFIARLVKPHNQSNSGDVESASPPCLLGEGIS
jgi:hypothetical protein